MHIVHYLFFPLNTVMDIFHDSTFRATSFFLMVVLYSLMYQYLANSLMMAKVFPTFY